MQRRAALVPDAKSISEVGKVATGVALRSAMAALRFKRLTTRNILTKGRFKPRFVMNFSLYAHHKKGFSRPVLYFFAV